MDKHFTAEAGAEEPQRSAVRLQFLDGLRGLAALGVVAHHYSAAFYPSSMTGDPATAHLPGAWELWFAASPVHVLLNFRVCFFFVLSGLVLAASAGRARPGLRPLLGLLVRRYLRLGLPLAAGVLLAWALLQAGVFYNRPAATASQAAWLAPFWAEVPRWGQALRDALYGVLVQGHTPYNPVLWTMRVEWGGSVLVLGLLATLGRWRGRLLAYAALALAIALARGNFYYVAFVLGLGLHDAYRRRWTARLPTLGRRALVLALLLAAAALAGHPQIYYHGPAAPVAYAWMRLPGVSPDRTVQLYHTLGAVALLAAALLSARVQRVVDVPWLRYVGRRAFALYLTHFLLLGSGSAWLFLRLRAGGAGYHASFGLMVLASLPVMAASTAAFYRWVDQPSHALARKWGRWVG